MTPAARTLLVRLAKYAILAVVLVYVGFAMRRDLSKVRAEDVAALAPSWTFVILAGLGLVGVNSVQMIAYRALLFAYGARPRWRQMAAIAWVPPLGKYVPGKVWALLGAMAMLRRFSIEPAVAFGVVIMLDAFSVLVGLIVSAPLLSEPAVANAFPAGRWLGPIAIVAGVVALSPPVFGRVLRTGLRLIKRPALARMPTWREYAAPIACAIAQWLFAGAALWCCARAVSDVDVTMYPRYVMVAACAMTISYLALIAPAGLGVREAIFLAALPTILPPDAPAGASSVITIAMRVLQTIVEVMLAGLGAWMLRLEGRAAARTAGNTNPHE